LARAAAADLPSPDLKARIELAAGRLHATRGRGDLALRELEEAKGHAGEADQWSLEAEVEEALADACELQGVRFLVRRHRARARELWERIAATLPSSFHDAFWRHPKRAEQSEFPDEVEPAAAASRAIRLMEINRQLSSSLRTEDVLRHTMDAAIELSGAERGFVILKREREDGSLDLHIPVARNLDREQLGRSHLKLSRSIAEKVLQTGEEVLTVDALADDRFRDNVSVHAMRLRSVACVPIRSGEGILGALYLDNRFQRGRFRQEDVSLLLAFADQAAIALRNARLLSALEERTEELEAERRKVQALVREQAEEIDRLSEEVQSRQPRSSTYRYDFSQIVGRGTAMQEVLSVLDRVIEAPWPVLIQGESGTGKELIARAVHGNGPRAEGPFVTVNCAALPAPLLESELFGHVKGAFTGATRDRKGLFVEARSGTLFLDEIGEMPLEMQSTLLRALEEREVRPVGSEEVIPVDVRLVCATNRRLRDEVEAGRFREDLFYRVAVMELTLPPLRERVEDIPALVKHLLIEAAREMGREPPELSSRGLRKLARYSWPGNVRQLRNILSKALVLTEGPALTAGDIELPRAERARRQALSRPEYEKTEASQILAALNTYRWNVAEVSRALGIPRSSLYRKLKKYGLSAPPKG
jgi:transcriptional regulator with GAF, ATPase, and Fis domain